MVGRRRLGNGDVLTARDRRGNEEADRLAKEAVQFHRVPKSVRQSIMEQEKQVSAMAWWVAQVTSAANSWGPQALRDSESAPARNTAPRVGRRQKPRLEEMPVALGGHDILYQGGLLARPWQCRTCHRSAAKRTALCYSRCPGSAVKRWAHAAAAAAASGEGAARGHHLLLTGTVAWCWRCGAYACVQARYLTRPCPGRARGFLAQARQRLLLGLHPSSRLPLGDFTVAEPGQSLPAGFSVAVREAEASRTSAAAVKDCLKLVPVPNHEPAQRSLFVTPRLAALRARVVAREASTRASAPRCLPSKRRRLHGKQLGQPLR